MQISDEMVEKAFAEYNSPKHDVRSDYDAMRAALEAVLGAEVSGADIKPPVDMRDQTKDLRDLGAKLEEVARRHRCYSQASQYVVVLRDFLTAVGAVNELNQELAKRDDIISAQSAEIARLREALEPFDRADQSDWDRLLHTLGWSGHDRFWRSVLEDYRRARAALETKG